MKVLGIDTSTAWLSAAVLDDDRVAAECVRESARANDRRPGRSNHSEVLIPLIEEALRGAETDFSSLSLLGVAVGPGSFTGLRIGISTVKGLVYGSETPVVGVRTLEAMAYGAPPGDDASFVCPLMDARKGEVYAALYRRTDAAFECLMEDCLAEPETLFRQVDAAAGGPCVFVGRGVGAYADLIARCTGGRARVAAGVEGPSTAVSVARIARRRWPSSADAADAASLAPWYIRPPDAAAPTAR